MAIANDPSKCDEIAKILKALGHPVRIRIVALLVNEDLHVGALCEVLDLPQAVVSQQLRILRNRGLVGFTRAQGRAVYRITELRLRELVACLEGCRIR